MRPLYFYIEVFFFFLLCFGTLFLNSSSFVNVRIDLKWYFFIFCSAAIVITFAARSVFSDRKNLRIDYLVLPVCLIITTICVIQAFYGIAQYMCLLPAFEIYRVIGSFDNPAGFAACLCAGFPFFFYFLAKKQLWIRCVSIAGMIIVGLAVFLSGSRAGMLSLAVVCMSGFFYFYHIRVRQKLLVGIIFATLMGSLYFMKKDSADGRLLIWRCSWEMIKDEPITGYGTGGFKANYMNYQARYFEENPNSKYVRLADNTSHPFNEYAGLLVNYGLAGFLFLISLLFYLIRTFRQNTNKTLFTYIACWCLTAIAVFAFFSYPLRYPFVWVILLLNALTIIRGNQCYLRHLRSIKKIIPVLILLLASIICIKNYTQLRAQMKWCKVAHLSLAGQTEQMLPEYRLLHNKLSNNELFLYNYAAELNFSKHYEESQSIARECECLWADYDLQMLMADNFQQLKNYTEAEQHYRKAATMCPAKFTPLYKLAKMYEKTERRSEAVTVAEQLVNKPIKMASPLITIIQQEMRRMVEKEKNRKLQNEKKRQGETPDVQSSGIALPP